MFTSAQGLDYNTLLQIALSAGLGGASSGVLGGDPLTGAGLGAAGGLGGLSIDEILKLSSIPGLQAQAKAPKAPPAVKLMKDLSIYALQNPNAGSVPVSLARLNDPRLFQAKYPKQPNPLALGLLGALGALSRRGQSQGGSSAAAQIAKSLGGLFKPSTNSGGYAGGPYGGSYTGDLGIYDFNPSPYYDFNEGFSTYNPSPYDVPDLNPYGNLNPYV